MFAHLQQPCRYRCPRLKPWRVHRVSSQQQSAVSPRAHPVYSKPAADYRVSPPQPHSPVPSPVPPMARPQTAAARPAWQGEVHEELYSLAMDRAPLLRARPRGWGKISVALVADLAGMQMTSTVDLQMPRPNLEHLAVDRLLQHFHGHIHAMSLRGTRGSGDSRVELCFDETPEAEAAQLAAVDDQRIALPAGTHEPAMTIPVRLGEGHLISPHLTRLVVHGLPARLCREGLGDSLLRCAGYSPAHYTVEGEFLGDLPARFSGCHAAARVGNSDACLIFIRAPAADRRLARLPRYFSLGEERIFISRPAHLRQPSSMQPSPTPPPPPPPTSGPRPIRVRQRAAAVARSIRSQPQPVPVQPDSCQLQDLETHLSHSRTPGMDRRGLGSDGHRAAPGAPAVAAFVPGSDSQPPVPMDCQPPIGAEVVPAIACATAMDIDARVPQTSASMSAMMECDTQPAPQPQPPSHVQELRQFEIDMAGVSMGMVDACFEWLTIHTHFRVTDIRAAFRQLYAAQPGYLRGGPLEADVQDRLISILRHFDDPHDTHMDDPDPVPGFDPDPDPVSGPDPVPYLPDLPAARTSLGPSSLSRPRQHRRCDTPPGFELQAAQMAAARALTGIPLVRRSARSHSQPREWWRSSPDDSRSDTRMGPSAASRRPARP